MCVDEGRGGTGNLTQTEYEGDEHVFHAWYILHLNRSPLYMYTQMQNKILGIVQTDASSCILCKTVLCMCVTVLCVCVCLSAVKHGGRFVRRGGRLVRALALTHTPMYAVN